LGQLSDGRGIDHGNFQSYTAFFGIRKGERII
jgi:hypothetical protein